MSKLIKKCKVLLCGAFICLLSGFYICTISTNTVFIGVAVMGIGAVVALSALFPAVKVVQLKNEEKGNRIKKLEEAVELLKKDKRG